MLNCCWENSEKLWGATFLLHPVGHSGDGLPRQQTHTHNNGTVSLTFTEKPNMKHKTQKRPTSNIVRTADYNCAYLTIMAVLIIFPVILQTVINLRMLSTGRQGTEQQWDAHIMSLDTQTSVWLWRVEQQMFSTVASVWSEDAWTPEGWSKVASSRVSPCHAESQGAAEYQYQPAPHSADRCHACRSAAWMTNTGPATSRCLSSPPFCNETQPGR